MIYRIRYLFWLWLSFEKPCKHPTISAKELMYIETSLGSSTQVAMPTIATTPWRAFMTSLPVYAIIVANFCRSWNFYLLVLFQASYLQNTFGFQIEEVNIYIYVVYIQIYCAISALWNAINKILI